MSTDWTEAILQLVHVDVESRTIDAGAWLSSTPAWYRAAAAGIVRHWARVLELPVVRAGTAAEWLWDIRRTARLLTPPCIGVTSMRGIIEWRHPKDRLSEDPIYGLCWLIDAGYSAYLCWTDLGNLECLGGPHVTQHLAEVTPLGGAAEELVAHVLHQIAIQPCRPAQRSR